MHDRSNFARPGGTYDKSTILAGLSIVIPSLAAASFFWWLSGAGGMAAAETTWLLGMLCAVGFVFGVAGVTTGGYSVEAVVGGGKSRAIKAGVIGMIGSTVMFFIGGLIGYFVVFGLTYHGGVGF
jgi:hypothetical protein